jgi:hypothetical protein
MIFQYIGTTNDENIILYYLINCYRNKISSNLKKKKKQFLSLTMRNSELLITIQVQHTL